MSARIAVATKTPRPRLGYAYLTSGSGATVEKVDPATDRILRSALQPEPDAFSPPA